MSSNNIAIHAQHLGKAFQLYERPIDRLKQMVMRGRKRYFKEFAALHDVSFELPKGEVLGLVGRNGAGKSTLLQLICGTLTPTTGRVTVHGRVAALLELGAGFNPEFTGRENIYLNASILGLSKDEIDARYDSIVEFSGIQDFIHQPVKTYSSGMYVRLAFSIATSVEAAASSSCVYGWRGAANSASASPSSTTSPFFMTITRCDMARTSARSWLMKI